LGVGGGVSGGSRRAAGLPEGLREPAVWVLSGSRRAAGLPAGLQSLLLGVWVVRGRNLAFFARNIEKCMIVEAVLARSILSTI